MRKRCSTASIVIAFGFLFAVKLFSAAEAPTAYKFNFGSGVAPPGWTKVLPAMIYTKESGFGFEPGANVSAAAYGGRGITGERPFLFSVALPEGNYNVTLTLGDAAGESANTIKAESRRLMLENVRTARGQFSTNTFTV